MCCHKSKLFIFNSLEKVQCFKQSFRPVASNATSKSKLKSLTSAICSPSATFKSFSMH